MKLSDALKKQCKLDVVSEDKLSGDELWFQTGEQSENIRLMYILEKVWPVIDAAEMEDTRYRYMDANGQECEGCELSDALAALKKEVTDDQA